MFTFGLGTGVCDHAAAATIPVATMTAGTISLFMKSSLGFAVAHATGISGKWGYRFLMKLHRLPVCVDLVSWWAQGQDQAKVPAIRRMSGMSKASDLTVPMGGF